MTVQVSGRQTDTMLEQMIGCTSDIVVLPYSTHLTTAKQFLKHAAKNWSEVEPHSNIPILHVIEDTPMRLSRMPTLNFLEYDSVAEFDSMRKYSADHAYVIVGIQISVIDAHHAPADAVPRILVEIGYDAELTEQQVCTDTLRHLVQSVGRRDN